MGYIHVHVLHVPESQNVFSSSSSSSSSVVHVEDLLHSELLFTAYMYMYNNKYMYNTTHILYMYMYTYIKVVYMYNTTNILHVHVHVYQSGVHVQYYIQTFYTYTCISKWCIYMYMYTNIHV